MTVFTLVCSTCAAEVVGREVQAELKERGGGGNDGNGSSEGAERKLQFLLMPCGGGKIIGTDWF